MDLRIFCFILVAGMLFSILVIVLEVAHLGNQGVMEAVRDIWRTYFSQK